MAKELDVIKGRKIVIYGAGTVADFFFYYLWRYQNVTG